MTDELEAIRTRHEADDRVRQYTGFLDAPASLRAARQAHADRATLLRLLSEERAAVNALPELLAKVKRLEADLQVIAFGWRYVAEPDNSLTKSDWTRDQLIEYARAALNQETDQ